MSEAFHILGSRTARPRLPTYGFVHGADRSGTRPTTRVPEPRHSGDFGYGPPMAPDHAHPAAGLELGYARVSTTRQSLDRHINALATAVLAGLALNAAASLWWADPAAGYVLVYNGAREAWTAFHDAPDQPDEHHDAA